MHDSAVYIQERMNVSKILLAIFVLLSLLIHVSASYTEFGIVVEHECHDESDFQQKFRAYIDYFKKNYTTEHEYNVAYANFKVNHNAAAERNHKYYSLGKGVHGINRFSDITFEMFKKKMTMQNRQAPEASAALLTDLPSLGSLPKSFDWRDKGAVTPVNDQGGCGSCWAFSVVETIEGQWILQGKGTNTTTAFSVQQLIDCDDIPGDEGCDGGDPPIAYRYIENAGGLMTNEDYPYCAYQGACYFQKTQVIAKVDSFSYATKNNSETMLQQSLYKSGPISICINCEPWFHYGRGILNEDCASTEEDLNHCVQLTGWGVEDNVPYWSIRNSWSEFWGEQGYIRLYRGKNLCGVTDEATLAVVSPAK